MRLLKIYQMGGLRYIIDNVFSSINGFTKKIFTKEAWKKREHGISVLLPVRNEEKVIGLCIESLLDFGDEIIVVDNGSKDKTKEIVLGYTMMHKKVKFFYKPMFNDLDEMREFALSKSKYDWVCRFDSDYVAQKCLNCLRLICLKTLSTP